MADEKRETPETEPCPKCGRPARVLGREPKILACVQHTTVVEK